MGGAFWKIRKQYEIRNNSSTIPASAKIKFGLNFTAPVRETESAKVLLGGKNEVVNKAQRILVELAHKTFELNVLDHIKE